MANNDGNLIVGLDIPKSVSQINADIKKLEKQLEQVKATGALDTSTTVKQINAQISALQSQLKTIEIKTNIDPKALQSVQKAEKQVANSQEQAYKNAQKELKKLYDLRIEYAKIDSPNNNQKYLYENAIKEQEKIWRKAYSNTSEPDNWNVQKRLELQRQEVAMQEKLEHAYGRVTEAKKQSKKVDEIQHSLDTEKYSTDIAKITNQLSHYSEKSGEVFTKANTSAQSLSKTYEKMKSIFADTTGQFTNDDKIEIERQYQIELEKTKNLLTQLTSIDDNKIVHVGESQRVNLINTLNKYIENNTAMTELSKQKIERWIYTLSSADDMTVGSIKNINNEFKQLDTQIRKSGQLGLSFTDKFKQAWEKFGGWSIATGTLMRGFQEVKNGIQFMYKLDDALTDVAYTSNVTAESLAYLGDSSIDMADDLNTSAENILEAVKIYSTATSTAEDILRKAQPAIMLSNISGMSGSESAKTINTSLNQFELEDTEESLLDITDTLQYVSGQLNYDFTEGIKEITEGIEASGNTAHNAGLSMQEYATMVGIAVEKTGQGGSTIGNAYKTIFSRITKASATEGTLEEDISAAEKSLRSIGVEVRTSAGEFRDLTDIMADLGEVWDSLSSVEKSNVGFQVAGTRQLNILNSLLGSWDDYVSIMENVDERSGTTLENQSTYAESLAGHLGDINASAQSIWNNLFDNEQFKDVLGAFNSLLTVIEKISSVTGADSLLVGGLGTYVANTLSLD